jgi:hypothetical protein
MSSFFTGKRTRDEFDEAIAETREIFDELNKIPNVRPLLVDNDPPRAARPEITDRVIEAGLAQLSAGGENGNF